MSLFTPHNGNIPLPALLLLRQIRPLMEHTFPDWEIPAAFPGQPDYFYTETGVVARIWPTGVEIEFPLFERLHPSEEKTLGESGRRKAVVAVCSVVGTCVSACASVAVTEICVKDNVTGELVWHWLAA